MIGNRLREERLRLESRVSKKATDTDKLDR